MRKTKKGSVLLFVMAIIFASSAILVSIAEYSRLFYGVRASMAKDFELRQDAYSALNVVIAVLKEYTEIDGDIYAATQGWENPFADKRITLPSGADVEVNVVDESGKIPLRSISVERLKKLLEAMNLNERDAQIYADVLFDWIDNDNSSRIQGAEIENYDDYTPRPPNRPLESFMELRDIKDLSDAFFDEHGKPTLLCTQFSEIFSLEAFSKTNLNSASESVLKVLLDAEEKTYSKDLFLALRGEAGSVSDGILWCKNQADLQSRGVADYPNIDVCYSAKYLKINITVKRGLGRYHLCVHYTNADEYASIIAKNSSEKKDDKKTDNKTEKKQGKSSEFKIVKIVE